MEPSGTRKGPKRRCKKRGPPTSPSQNTTQERKDTDTRSIQSNNTQNTNTTEGSRKRRKRKTRNEARLKRIMDEFGLNDTSPSSLEDGPKISVQLSMFFGNPEQEDPKLDHFLLSTSAPEKFMKIGQVTPFKNKTPPTDGTDVGGHLNFTKTFASLAVQYNEQILDLPPQLCSVCQTPSPKSVVHRPLFCTLTGYTGKADGHILHPLMNRFATHVESLNTPEKKSEALGEMGHGPYVHEIAAAVCFEESECHEIASRNIDHFIESNLKKAEAPVRTENELSKGMAKLGVDKQDSKKKHLSDKAIVYVNDEGHELVHDDDSATGKELFPETANYIDAGMLAASSDLAQIRLSVFCGRPILDVNVPPRGGRISSFLFTSKWPTSFASGGSGKPYAQEYQNYRVIAGFHNQHILEAAHFKCAMCPDDKPAKDLVHHLISFKRDNTIGPQAAGIKRTVMKLYPFVGGRWKFNDMMSALGQDGLCHINEWVVPICRRNTNCDSLARIAVKESMKRFMPEDARPMHFDMFPDTVFSRPFPQVKGGKCPKIAVKRIAGGIISSDGKMAKAPSQATLDKEVDVFFKEMQVLVAAEREKEHIEAAKRLEEAKKHDSAASNGKEEDVDMGGTNGNEV